MRRATAVCGPIPASSRACGRAAWTRSLCPRPRAWRISWRCSASKRQHSSRASRCSSRIHGWRRRRQGVAWPRRSSPGPATPRWPRRWLHTSAAQAKRLRMAEIQTPQAARPRSGAWTLAIMLVVLAAIVAGLWLDTRGRIGSTQEEFAKRLRDIETDSRDARSLARQGQEALREVQGKLGALETRFAEAQSQQLALETLYQELARNRDEWQLAEIEQVLAIAQEQLQLSGNVRAALLALQLAESRLSRADRPQFLPVRRALTRDVERLKSLPLLDVPGLSLTLDRLGASVDALPLAFEERIERPAPAQAAKPAAVEES